MNVSCLVGAVTTAEITKQFPGLLAGGVGGVVGHIVAPFFNAKVMPSLISAGIGEYYTWRLTGREVNIITTCISAGIQCVANILANAVISGSVVALVAYLAFMCFRGLALQ